eukprot:Clim_evm99s243 gene=Clim_evmTU99s243
MGECSDDLMKQSVTGNLGPNVTQFVALSEFTDQQLSSDFNFLDEVGRVVAISNKRPSPYSKDRTLKQSHVNGCEETDASQFRSLPRRWRLLRTAAEDRQTRLYFTPPGLSLRTANTSYYHKKSDEIFWRLEVCFNVSSRGGAKDGHEGWNEEAAKSEPYVYREKSVSENRSLLEELGDVFESKPENARPRLLLPEIAAAVESNSVMKSYAAIIPVPHRPRDQTLYWELAWDKPMKETLKGCGIIEFPQVLVVSRTRICTTQSETASEQPKVRYKLAERHLHCLAAENNWVATEATDGGVGLQSDNSNQKSGFQDSLSEGDRNA